MAFNYDKIAEYMVKARGTQIDDFDDEVERVSYGLYVLISNVCKPIIFFILAYFLHVFKLAVIFFISFAFLRKYAGGIHLKSNIMCLILTPALFLSCVLAGAAIKGTLVYKLPYLILLAVVVAGLVYLTPANTPNFPVESQKQKRKLKISVGFTLSVLNCAILFLGIKSISNVLYLCICLVFVIVILQSIQNKKHTKELYLEYKKKYGGNQDE